MNIATTWLGRSIGPMIRSRGGARVFAGCFAKMSRYYENFAPALKKSRFFRLQKISRKLS